MADFQTFVLPRTRQESYENFSAEDLRVCTNNFHEKNLLGEGSFGKVFLGMLEYKNSNGLRAVAIKRSNEIGRAYFLQWMAEQMILPILEHPNIIKLIGYSKDAQHLYLIYEYIAMGTFHDVLQQLNWRQSLEVAKGLAEAIDFLHRQDDAIIFQDIKSDNMLFNEVSTLIAVYANWGFASIKGVGWGWAGVIWLYSGIIIFALGLKKFFIDYILSRKDWRDLFI